MLRKTLVPRERGAGQMSLLSATIRKPSDRSSNKRRHMFGNFRFAQDRRLARRLARLATGSELPVPRTTIALVLVHASQSAAQGDLCRANVILIQDLDGQTSRLDRRVIKQSSCFPLRDICTRSRGQGRVGLAYWLQFLTSVIKKRLHCTPPSHAASM